MIKVIDLSQKAIWSNVLANLPLEVTCVYQYPEYYEIFENYGDGKAYCLIYKNESKILIYPFLKREIFILELQDINSRYFDIEGAYGLNGASAVNINEEDINIIKEFWFKYCEREKIIAEFTRFNPLFKNNFLFNDFEVSSINKVIIVNLKCDNLLYDSYEHSTRKGINKARKNKIKIENFTSENLPEDYLNTFLNIYHGTMDRNFAKKNYYYDLNFFNLIKRNLKKNSQWFFSILDGKIISVELVLYDSFYCFSFLGGTIKDYFYTGANILLKHEIILFFKNRNLEKYFLGGGVKIEDGIYKYKKGFSKSSDIEYFIGKKIHNLKFYLDATSYWEMKNPEKKNLYKDYFFRYRM
jgi:hypothetical protein